MIDKKYLKQKISWLCPLHIFSPLQIVLLFWVVCNRKKWCARKRMLKKRRASWWRVYLRWRVWRIWWTGSSSAHQRFLRGGRTFHQLYSGTLEMSECDKVVLFVIYSTVSYVGTVSNIWHFILYVFEIGTRYRTVLPCRYQIISVWYRYIFVDLTRVGGTHVIGHSSVSDPDWIRKISFQHLY